jgi:hypothetical protein
MQSRFNSPTRDIERLGDLVVRHLLELAEHDHISMLRGKPGDRRVNVDPGFNKARPPWWGV